MRQKLIVNRMFVGMMIAILAFRLFIAIRIQIYTNIRIKIYTNIRIGHRGSCLPYKTTNSLNSRLLISHPKMFNLLDRWNRLCVSSSINILIYATWTAIIRSLNMTIIIMDSIIIKKP